MPDSVRPSFNRHPIFILSVCLAVGILIGKFTSAEPLAAIAISMTFGVAALLFRRTYAATILISIAFTAAGVAAYSVEIGSVRPDRIKTLYDNGTLRSGLPVEVEGVLLGRPEPSVDGAFLTLRVDRLRDRGRDITVSGNARSFVPLGEDGSRSQVSDLKYGSRIRVACSLEREDEYLNPGVLTKRELLDRLGVDATCSLKSPLLIEHIADESVFLPLAWVYDQRANLIDECRRNLSPRAAGVMIASLLGNKYFLDKDTADLFRDGGTFHILVISGLHITFIGGLLLLFLRQVTRNRWLQFAVTTATLWAYTLAVGADVPVVRAAIMFTVVLLGYSIYRQGSLLNSLGLCGLLLLVWRPSDLFSPSFQLTFVSVAAIVACAYPLIEHLRSIGGWTPTAAHPFPPNVPDRFRRFCEMLYWSEDAWAVESRRQIWTANLIKSPLLAGRIRRGIQKIVRSVFEGILVSLIVQIWMLPLTVVYFHRISIASILLNLWVGFLIAIESFAAVAGVIAGYFSGLLAAGFYAIADAVNWLMLTVPRLFSDGGWASFRLPAYAGAGSAIYVLYFVPILCAAFLVTRWDPFAIKRSIVQYRVAIMTAAMTACLAGVVTFHPFSSPAADGRLHIEFIDVGQGDSALITFPNGMTMLVDGGGRFDYGKRDEDADSFEPDVRGIGEAVVSEVLWAKGYSRIDHIVATHADADHVQGLTDVAKNFRVGSAVFGRMPTTDPDIAELLDVLRRRGIPVDTAARGDVIQVGDVKIEVLYPTAIDDPNALSGNNNSVVLRIVCGSRAFLLTGDIEREAETQLLARGSQLAADIVKVPHHGSRTSSTQEFVNAVGAKFAIIPVGRRSPFGHPHAEVVERWKAAAAHVMTTGERGMISVSTDGSDMTINYFTEEHDRNDE